MKQVFLFEIEMVNSGHDCSLFRNFDPVLGRMTQVDPMADRYSSFSTYNFAFNDPVFWNDPLGDSPVDDANRSRNADIQRNQANTYRPIGDDMYGSYYSRYGPGDGGALNDFAAPIVERLKWIQAQVAQGASFVGGRVFYSEWVPD
ncbi:MAG: hypothetical protein JNL53_05720, partial [Cyclobacteriaceae bacterium]|nr:hypothetical protein [Cyclobacteriaceae bacterium]